MIGSAFSISTLAMRGARSAAALPPVAVFDFTAGGLPAGVTLSRGSPGTRYDAAGVLVTDAIDTPRFDHDPQTLAPKGLLLEGLASNLVANASDLSATGWTRNTFVPNAQTDTAPDGSTVPGWSFGSGYAYHDLSVTANLAHTASFWIKANQNCTIGLRACGTTGADTQDLAITTGWSRIAMTATPTSTTPKILLENRSGQGYGVPGLEVFIWGVQVEEGMIATSHIPTAGAVASRLADVPGITGVTGTYDVRVNYFGGTSATILSVAVSDGWWPPQSSPWITSIELHTAGSLA